MRKEMEWATCNNCAAFFLPKISAKIEIEQESCNKVYNIYHYIVYI